MTLKQSLGEGARLAMSWTHHIANDPHLEKEFRFPGEWGGQSLVLKRLFSQAMDPGPCQLAPRMFCRMWTDFEPVGHFFRMVALGGWLTETQAGMDP